MFSLKFDEIQEQVRDTAAKFAREEIAPSVIERDTESKFPKEILEKLGELGFLGMMTSADYGGSELDA
ncbi:MAG: acyl-CoA dehydrogenase family protein, partial [Chlorobi bacterium]|nr:acyl-CoA dehydrogenase family protein [Chlorobiota bacterium]